MKISLILSAAHLSYGPINFDRLLEKQNLYTSQPRC